MHIKKNSLNTNIHSNIFSFLIIFLVFALAFAISITSINFANASVGIGLKWSTESEMVNEGKELCINYGLYNPFDQDVTGYLEATKELNSSFTSEQPKLIPANTSSNNSINSEICFKFDNVYKKKCILGLFCERKCDKLKTYSGEVMAAYSLPEKGGGTGSVVGTSFAAPLKLTVKCEPLERNKGLLYSSIAVIVIIILIIIFLSKRKKRKHRRRF